LTTTASASMIERAKPGTRGVRRGLGLIGIRERAAQLGGTVTIETAPGKGTRLTVELPARRREANERDQMRLVGHG
jgi:signal transduction histidine kinase